MRSLAVVLALVRIASADPAPLPHVLTAPTAWLPGPGTVVGIAGLDHRGDGHIGVGYGLGELAAVELGDDTDVRACTAPPCTTDNRANPLRLGRASFKLAAREDAWFAG